MRSGYCFANVFGEAHGHRAFADVALVSHFDHGRGQLEGDTLGVGEGGAGGRQDQLAHLARVVQGQELRHPAAHGVPAHDGVAGAHVVHNGGHVVGEHVGGVGYGRLAGAAGATVVEGDALVIPGVLRHRIHLPHLAVARRLADEYERPSLAAHLVIELYVIALQNRHGINLPSVSLQAAGLLPLLRQPGFVRVNPQPDLRGPCAMRVRSLIRGQGALTKDRTGPPGCPAGSFRPGGR